jgi:hypothetical protein
MGVKVRTQQVFVTHHHSRKLGKYWCLAAAKVRQAGRRDAGLSESGEAGDQKQYAGQQSR